MAERVTAEDRLFSLVLTLLATEHGLTKAQIFETVRGYEPLTNGGAKLESLERKFERDKNDLRELGIPIETFDSPEAPGDNQLLRYRISNDAYEFPADISFTAAEIALLTLAGDVWREGTVSAVAHRALTKLRAFDIEPDAPILGYVPRLRTREAVFDELNRDIDANQRVRFSYLKAGAAAAEQRDITPLALGLVDGRWHVLGFDHDRSAERIFLLSRIHGKLAKSNEPAAPSDATAADRLVESLQAFASTNVAVLHVRPGSTAATEFSHRQDAAFDGTERLRVHYLDEAILAEEIAAAGPEVSVLSPESLRERVLAILRRAAAAHGGAA